MRYHDSDTVVNVGRVTITVVKSAVVYGGFTPTLHNCDKEHQKILYTPGHPIYRKRILAAPSFGPTKKPRYTYVAISAGDDLWIAKVLALVRVKEGGTSNYAELAFVQYICLLYTSPSPRDS